ncbi:MAG: 50S ribosomal protein L19 [Oscillospiraceae bacterium]|nr:50S ribosomal protein L19 [Oscillospiraceae bacterium]
MNALELIAQDSLKKEVPDVTIGNTVRVHVRIKEGERERIQIFEGTVIAKQHGGISETFTVRRLSHGVGVERVFPLHSPTVDKVETIRKGRVRRGKLYYLRERVGKTARVKEALHRVR